MDTSSNTVNAREAIGTIRDAVLNVPGELRLSGEKFNATVAKMALEGDHVLGGAGSSLLRGLTKLFPAIGKEADGVGTLLAGSQKAQPTIMEREKSQQRTMGNL